jgi:chromosome segregation ATPase
VLESILSQLDRQDDTIKVLQRSAKSHRDTTTRHEELIQQQQLLIANLLQQQSSLFTMVSSVNDKQQQQQQLIVAATSTNNNNNNTNTNNTNNTNNSNNQDENPPTNTQTTTSSAEINNQQQLINNLNTKLALKDQKVAELITKTNEQQQTIAVINQGYNQQSEEIDKLNQLVKKLELELQIAKSELSRFANEKNLDPQNNQVIKLKPVYQTLDQQLKRLETDIQIQSKTGIQLIIKTLVGRATIVECDISDTIATVKHKISEQTAIPLKDQILLTDGKELNNEHSILQLGLLNQTTLHLILKNRGRGQ